MKSLLTASSVRSLLTVLAKFAKHLRFRVSDPYAASQNNAPFLLLLLLWPLQSLAVCLPNLTPETNPENFIDRGEIIEDKSTGLMWQRCSLGLVWDATSRDCLVTPNAVFRFTWEDASNRAYASRLGGYSNWRLPNKNELLSITDHACTGPAINETLFPGTPYLTIASVPPNFWTSSPSVNFPGSIWGVLATTGELQLLLGNEQHYVRMVRDTQ